MVDALKLAMDPHAATWTVAALATAGVIFRPFGWPEAVWAVGGAIALLVLRLIGFDVAWSGIAKGTDVYLFLTGMMLLAEVARRESLFDWLAAVTIKRASGSPFRLFALIYGVGVIVTVFMSNDATAVVLTPAVAAAVKTAKVKDTLPFLLICAFISNAASFVLPISNPANLVIYGSHMPSLMQWLPRFALPSIASIIATFVVLRWTQSRSLANDTVATDISIPALSGNGRLAAAGLVITAIVLLTASAFDLQLGLPTAICGTLTAVAVLLRKREMPWRTVKDISWGVLPLVAGLFVLVEALDETGLLASLGGLWRAEAQRSATQAAWLSGAVAAFGCNLLNNLPAGLIAASAVQGAHVPDRITSAILIGVDLGPNLSVTGSLATILWLNALKRENISIGAWQFLKLGALVMPPALLLTLASLLAMPN